MRLLVLVVAVFLVHPVVRAYAQSRADDVLVLNSYHPTYEWTDRLVRGIHAALDGTLPAENLHVEYMDARRMVDDEPYLDLLSALLEHKYRSRRPDVIISSDDSALTFLLARRDTLFPGVPIVFCGVNARSVDELAVQPDMTGILEGLAVKENLELIVRLHPRASKVVLLSDRTSLGRDMTAVARTAIESFAGARRKFEVWDDFTIEELGDRVAKLKTDSVILMLAIHEDRAGRYFSYDEHLPGLTARSAVPVYAMFGMLLGHGVVGGMMNDPFEHGRSAATMALEVMAGVPADRIPIEPSAAYLPRFDAKPLARFGMDEASLPPGSRVLGRQTSFYQQHRSLVWSVTMVVCVLAFAVVWLIGLIRRMRQAERELLEREAELRHAQRLELVGRLAGGIAHDFNNLLVPIWGCAELLEKRVAPTDLVARQHCDALRLATDRAAQLVRQILALSRPKQLQSGALDLNALLHDLEPLLCRVVHEQTQLTVRVCDERVWVHVDRARLEQAVINLVVNANDAIRGTPEGKGRIDLEVHRETVEDAPWGVLTVSDTGTGMNEDVRARAFDPFFTTKPSGRGTGLGLSTSQSTIAQYGGTLTVRPPSGRGTTFEIRLPVGPAPDPDAQPSSASEGPRTRERVRVLVVDDDELARAVLVEGLRSLGHEARSADSREAEKLLTESSAFDFLLCDVMMPEPSGPELWERVRGQCPSLRVIFMTGYDAGLVDASGALLSEVPTLHKPFALEQLDALLTIRTRRAPRSEQQMPLTL